MPITFVAAGAFAANATLATQNIVAPTLVANDVMLACVINKALGNVISAPDGTWTQIVQDDNDCTTAADDHRFAIFWKRAAGGDSGATFAFTKATDDNSFFGGMIGAFRGCVTPGSPLDATAPGVQKTAAQTDDVTFPALDPTGTDVHVVFIAFYLNDLTTFAAAMSADTNPDCTLRWDTETATGTDCTIACMSGDNNGASIASRTWAAASTADAGNTGVVFALLPPGTSTAGAVGAQGAFAPLGGW